MNIGVARGASPTQAPHVNHVRTLRNLGVPSRRSGVSRTIAIALEAARDLARRMGVSPPGDWNVRGVPPRGERGELVDGAIFVLLMIVGTATRKRKHDSE